MRMDPKYFQGVAVGLTIAWVTTAIAYYVRGYSKTPKSIIFGLFVFELVVSVIMLIVARLV